MKRSNKPTRSLLLANGPAVIVVSLAAVASVGFADHGRGARVALALLAGPVAALLSLVAHRSVRAALGDRAAPARATSRVARRVIAAHGAAAAVAASPFALVASPYTGGDDVWLAAGLVTGVVMLSAAGIHTVVLDGSSRSVGLLRVLAVFPLAVPGAALGYVAGFATWLAAAVVASPLEWEPSQLVEGTVAGVVWWLTTLVGITAGTALSTIPIWLGWSDRVPSGGADGEPCATVT